MVFFCNADGVIEKVIPERVFQGSAGVNKIVFVGAFPSSSQVLMAFTLPNGLIKAPIILTHVAELEDVKTSDGKAYSGWVGVIGGRPMVGENNTIGKDTNGNILYEPDFSITEYSGVCKIQFYVYSAASRIELNSTGQIINADSGMIATAHSSFTIEKGVPVLVPTVEEMQDMNDDWNALLKNILAIVSNTQEYVDTVNRSTVCKIKTELLDKTLSVEGYSSDDGLPITSDNVELPFVNVNGDTMTGPLVIDDDGVKTEYGVGKITNKGSTLNLPEKDGNLVTEEDVTRLAVEADSNKVSILKYEVSGKTLYLSGFNEKNEFVTAVDIELPFVTKDDAEFTKAIAVTHGGSTTKYDAGGITNAGYHLTFPQKHGTIATQDDIFALAPSGGGNTPYRLIREITLTEDVQEINISTDGDGKTFALKGVFLQFFGTLTGGAGSRTLRCSFNNGLLYQMYHITSNLSANFVSKSVCQWIKSERLNIPDRKMWVSKYSTMLESSSGENSNNIQGLSGMNSVQYCDLADKSTVLNGDGDKITSIRYGLANTNVGLFGAGSKIFIWGVDDE